MSDFPAMDQGIITTCRAPSLIGGCTRFRPWTRTLQFSFRYKILAAVKTKPTPCCGRKRQVCKSRLLRQKQRLPQNPCQFESFEAKHPTTQQHNLYYQTQSLSCLIHTGR